jgi:hypothetical protein
VGQGGGTATATATEFALVREAAQFTPALEAAQLEEEGGVSRSELRRLYEETLRMHPGSAPTEP